MAVMESKKDCEKAESDELPASKVPYDRGYAWVIVFAAAMIVMILAGCMKSVSIFFVEIQSLFGASRANIALIFGVYSLVAMLTSLPARVLVERIGARNVTMLGALFVALSNILSAFVPSFYFLFISIGVCGGVGVAFTFSPTLVLVCSYFKKYRSVANALTVSGNAIGGLLVPPIANSLIDQFDLRGSFLLTGGIALHGVLFAALLLPMEFWTPSLSRSRGLRSEQTATDTQRHLSMESGDDEKEQTTDTQCTWHRSLLHFSDGHVMVLSPQHETLAEMDQSQLKAKHVAHLAWRSESDLRRRSVIAQNDVQRLYVSLNELARKRKTARWSITDDSTYFVLPSKLEAFDVSPMVTANGKQDESEPQSSTETCSQTSKPKLRQTIAKLLRNPRYVTLAVCHACFTESFKALMVCIPAHLVSLGFSRTEAVQFMMCMYLADLLGRLGSIGVALLIQRANSRFFTKRVAYVIYIHCFALAVVAFAQADADKTLVFVSLAFVGVFSGLGVANHAVVLAENCDLPIELLGMAHSLGMLFQSVFVVLMTYALGSLADVMQTWKWSLIISASFCHLGALVANSDVYSRLLKRLVCSQQPPSSSPTHADSLSFSHDDCPLRSR